MVSLLMIMETLDSLFELNVIGYTLEEVRIKIEKQLLEDYFKKGKYFVTAKLAGYILLMEIGGTGTRVLFQSMLQSSRLLLIQEICHYWK
jgi:hypothetical protein